MVLLQIHKFGGSSSDSSPSSITNAAKKDGQNVAKKAAANSAAAMSGGGNVNTTNLKTLKDNAIKGINTGNNKGAVQFDNFRSSISGSGQPLAYNPTKMVNTEEQAAKVVINTNLACATAAGASAMLGGAATNVASNPGMIFNENITNIEAQPSSSGSAGACNLIS